MTTDNFCFYLQNRRIQNSQTRGQRYSDTPPFSIPCSSLICLAVGDEEESFVALTPGKVGDQDWRVGAGHGLAAPSKEGTFQVGQGKGFEHLVKLVAEYQVPDESEGHFRVPVDDVGGRDVHL